MVPVRKTNVHAMSHTQRRPSWSLGSAECIPAQGAHLSCSFPCAELAAKDSVPGAAGTLSHGHVLFIDDEAPLAALGKELLEECGYEVTTCTSSLSALDMFRAAPERYDAVITDQTMPNLSGEDLSRELLKIRPTLPIILSTGLNHATMEETARNVGIQKILVKPYLSLDLVLALQEILGKMDSQERPCDV